MNIFIIYSMKFHYQLPPAVAPGVLYRESVANLATPASCCYPITVACML